MQDSMSKTAAVMAALYRSDVIMPSSEQQGKVVGPQHGNKVKVIVMRARRALETQIF